MKLVAAKRRATNLAKTSPYKKLLGNSIIFTIGNIGSKLITFLMLPVYTYTLTQKEYGVTDLATTTAGFFLPIIFLSISDAVLRFALDRNEDKKTIFMDAFVLINVVAVGAIIASIILQLLNIQYAFYVGIILVMQAYQQLLAQTSKAIGKQRIFAANGILLAFFTASLNILFLVFFKWGIDGFFSSLILANLLSNLYLSLRIHIKRFIGKNYFSSSKLKEMLHYSVPLIPNAIAWWGTNDINRYLILYFLGSAFNGLFAVASKVPSIINLLNSIFFQSWQLSAIEEFDKDNKDEFFSNIFKYYSQFLFLGTIVLICLSKVFMRLVVSPNFYQAWKFSPFLLLATLYQCFSGLVGQVFVASKQTKHIFSTTVYGVVFNIVLTGLLLPIIGLQGAGIGSAVSFFVVWLIRQIRVKRIMNMSINWMNIVVNNVLLLLQAGVLFLHVSIGTFCIFSAVLIILSLFTNRSVLSLLVKGAKSFL